MIYLGADHRGLQLKEQIKKYLESVDIEAEDLGAYTLDKNDDYTDVAQDVARYVRLKKENIGFLFCGSGVGVDIVANKHQDIRSALCFNKDVAKQSREHISCNVACIPSDFVSFDEAKDIVLTFIKASFSFEERHVRRLSRIVNMEGRGLV